MERELRPELQIRVHSRRNNNLIHPVELESPSQPLQQNPVVYHEIKHFKSWFPWLNPVIVIANVVMFVITMYVNDCPKNSSTCILRFLGRFSFQTFKENPMLGPSSNALEKLGALDARKVLYGHQKWRLFTCIWLHAGVFHLLANMLSLLVIGIPLERDFGFVRVGLLYVICGLGGSLLSALFNQTSISVGASGAVFGLLGAMLSELITNWSTYTNKVGSLVTLLIIIVSNLAIGIFPNVDNFAHIGGLVSGFLLGFVFLIRPQFKWVAQRYTQSSNASAPVRSKFKSYQCVLWTISLILIIAGYTIGLILLFKGFNGNDHCSWCHYLHCIPTKKWSCKQSALCTSEQIGNQYNVTCTTNGRYKLYTLSNPTDSQMQDICSQLCG
ncbi:Peptidase S54, rhomboid domain [Dillenia turbinata]|uniref:RHOMBOID-like protein n=1 Tax=Dillenia turbinata TaxID=194707 RepID=A0AAN8W1G9_9MAGN